MPFICSSYGNENHVSKPQLIFLFSLLLAMSLAIFQIFSSVADDGDYSVKLANSC